MTTFKNGKAYSKSSAFSAPHKGVFANFKEAFLSKEKEAKICADNILRFIQELPNEAQFNVKGDRVKAVADIIEKDAKLKGFALGFTYAVVMYLSWKLGRAFGEAVMKELDRRSYSNRH